MRVNVVMPKMGESINEGTIIKWHKKPGDRVKKDEIIFEISTDKVDTEIPSPADGILLEVKVFEQETVPVDSVVAVIETSVQAASAHQPSSTPREPQAAEAPAQTPPAGSAPDVKQPQPSVSAKTAATEQPGEQSQKENTPAEDEQGKGRFYSPLVLSIAEKENISITELGQIKGTGNSGRITKNDVLQYLNRRSERTSVQTPEVEEEEEISYAEPQSFTPQPEQRYSAPAVSQQMQTLPRGNVIPMDNVRQKIMKHMVVSRDTSVHVSGIVEADMTGIADFIKNNKELYLKRENIKLTFMPFIAYACIKALKEYPYVNASIDGTNIVVKDSVNLGFAVAVEPDGLMVPNIKNADQKNLKGLAVELASLSEKARTKKLVPDDISGGTFTITNYGVFGTLFGTPVINQPEVAILGTGAVTKKPVVLEINGSDVIAVRSMMYLSLSHDHRLIDGMMGGRFLSHIKNTLENTDWKSVF